MIGVKTESKYGANVLLDQCPQCGGLWFDGDELYLAKSTTDENYAALNVDSLVKPVAITSAVMKCPRDNTALNNFTDPYFPAAIKIETCPQCSGFWFNRGEFKEFQEYRLQSQVAKNPPIEKPQDEAFKKQIEALLASEGAGNTFDSLGRFGSYLMTPVGQGGISRFSTGKSSGQDDWSRAVMMAVRVLLKIFLKI